MHMDKGTYLVQSTLLAIAPNVLGLLDVLGIDAHREAAALQLALWCKTHGQLQVQWSPSASPDCPDAGRITLLVATWVLQLWHRASLFTPTCSHADGRHALHPCCPTHRTAGHGGALGLRTHGEDESRLVRCYPKGWGFRTSALAFRAFCLTVNAMAATSKEEDGASQGQNVALRHS